MLKIRIDKRVRYEGNGDISPAGPPNYFQKLLAKYQKDNCPDWLRKYFPDDAVRGELVYLRKEALYHAVEAAKLEVRTTRGWHHKRNVGELRILGGRLARLKKQAAAESEVAQVESEIRIQRSRRPSARAKVEELLEMSQYRWHTVMFIATEFLRSPGRYASLPPNAIQGLCHWLSFPEVGIRCTVATIKTARRHFYIERRKGRSYRVYEYRLPRNIHRPAVPGIENAASLNEQVRLNNFFKCRRCGRHTGPTEMGLHLKHEENIPVELIGLSLDPQEFYRTDTDETLASYIGISL